MKHIVVTLKEWCSGANNECSSESIINIKISGANNPSSTRAPKESFKIVIETDEGYCTD